MLTLKDLQEGYLNQKDIHDYYYWVWFPEQQQQVSRQQVGVGDEGLQLARGFDNEIYLP